MKSQDEFETDSTGFFKEVGTPLDLILDGFSDQTKSSVKMFCDQVSTDLKTLERATPWSNRAELCIGLLK